ncbi:TfuA-like protein [Streptomyces sp. NBC_00199]|uniref:TfuA-like protein n=1 Tax=Streptomyces sp. NBC_00199 TaxID=2975678 RepID=UPI0022573CA3|nr:TfuA-like protein [Streptomyces sp. NBC_00199]MCX5269417.1 TfuA domain-containing protein [Streptomyces sp. NBC_00199]
MTVFLFAGPSLPRSVRERCAGRAVEQAGKQGDRLTVVLPPVAAGDLPRLGARPGDTVGIVDGFFHRRPAVRHKEILDLLDSGVRVHGAASMGALRAAELSEFGMTGHGRIFTDYHRGAITADDEVALLHGTEAEDYQSYTEALVNVRYALADAAARGLLSTQVAEAVLAAGARLPFVERTRAAVLAAAAHGGIGERELVTVDEVLTHAPDVKRTDALALLKAVLGSDVRREDGGERIWRLRETLHLRQWRSAARGSHDPAAGWVPEEQIHRLAQVLAVDYPSFREQVAMRHLAAQHTARHTDGPGGGPALADCPPFADVVEQLRFVGLLAPGADADPGLDRWCTAAERDLPDRVRTAKAAARALFPPHALLWHDPFLAELKTTGAHLMVRERLVSCLRFHRTLGTQRPTLQTAQLRSENILAHFARRWGRDDLEDAVLERGFATVEDFLASARSFYLYDKAHPDAGPLVLQTAAVGDHAWSR